MMNFSHSDERNSDKHAATQHSAVELETAKILQSIRNSSTTTAIANTAIAAPVASTAVAGGTAGLPADLVLSLDLHDWYTRQYPFASYHFDASTMAPLNVVSKVSKALIY
jgi:hypothetical protein